MSDRTPDEAPVVFIDRHGNEHFPPDPPRVNGCLPWSSPPHQYPRETPLRTCPSARCRRAKACRAPHPTGHCQKTHMDAESFRAALADKIDRLHASRGIVSNSTPEQAMESPGPEIKRAFEQCIAARQARALRTWQLQWVDEMKAREREKHPPRRRITIR